MVGTGIKKFAKENNWQIKNGIAFGVYRGYMMSMQEGAGWKSLSIAARLENEDTVKSAYELLNDKDIMKDYRITGSQVSATSVYITFLDNPGTMKKMFAFMDSFCDGLDSFGVKGANYCSSCGQELYGSNAVPAVMNDVVFLLHESCMNKDDETMNTIKEEKAKEGSTLLGSIGAFVGALVGAIPWAVAYYFGWFVGWFGFVIGLAAKKGYELLQGKESRAKGFIVIVATFIGTFFAESIALMVGMGIAWSQEGIEFYLLDIVYSYFYALVTDSEVLMAVLTDVALGLVFAVLGIWSVVKDIFKTTGKKANRFIRLDK